MSEIIDIYDENMNHLGTMEKWKARESKKWHRGAHIWITDGENVLVQLRAPDKVLDPNKWDVSAGGHCSAGETPLQGAKREYEEELGLKWDFGNINEDCIISYGAMDNGRINNGHVYLYFLKKKLDLSKLKIQKEELADLKYVPYKEFLQLFYSNDFVSHPKIYKDAVVKGLSKIMN